jgi:putative hydrolase of the HAD superfamily
MKMPPVNAVKYILFDCMETLVDMDPLPSGEDYALWAFRDSGLEGLWTDFSEFRAGYERARETLNRLHADFTEDSFTDRFTFMCERNPRIGGRDISPQDMAKRLSDRFLKTYYERCFVNEDVRKILPGLASRYRLGVVSNFKTHGGIETLLAAHGLAAYFEFILVSIDFGFRKPHHGIYNEAINRAKTPAQAILFIGDDPQNDVAVPGALGMQTLLFDRYGRHDGKHPVIRTFYDLEEILNI